MTHEQAHKILDRVKDGTAYSRRIIDEALWLTGDIDSHEAVRGEGMDQPVEAKSDDGWGQQFKRLVAQNDHGHKAHPWARGCE